MRLEGVEVFEVKRHGQHSCHQRTCLDNFLERRAGKPAGFLDGIPKRAEYRLCLLSGSACALDKIADALESLFHKFTELTGTIRRVNPNLLDGRELVLSSCS